MASPLLLRPLQAEDECSFRAGMQEFKEENEGYSFALFFEEAQLSFEEYLFLLNQWSEGRNLPKGFVRHSLLVGVVDGEVVGRVSIRHELNEVLAAVGGHIGYMVRPAFRGRGYATDMLGQAVIFAGGLGLTRVLVTCDESNVASAGVIEKNGGVLESVVEEHPEIDEPKRRDWIEVAG